ncbi:MAG TPA: sugar phosphate isomerase/epimerase [Candidatus Binatia bacterium]|nr:sugar phosphate isomerase/epimerase [Candidatus Binatia bacterium]
MAKTTPTRRSEGRGLGRNDLIASYYTLSGAPVGQPARFSLEERVAAAAAAGFSAIGLAVEDYRACRHRGMSTAEMRRMLADSGITVAELEFLTNWWHDGNQGRRSRLIEEQLYAAADTFGSRHMNVGSIGVRGTLPALGVVADHFAALCDRAARHGLLVALEFLPWSDISDAGMAWEIVRRAECDNGGILIDSWHYFRGAADPAQVRAIPAEQFFAIQFDDADAMQIGGFLEDTTQRRRLPGEGAFDLIGFVQMLDEIGVQAPVSVEIISTEQQARPLAEAARLAHDTTRAVLTQARAGVAQ